MTAEQFKAWMTEYIKSDVFDSNMVLEKLNTVHYQPEKFNYIMMGNSTATGFANYGRSNTTTTVLNDAFGITYTT